MTRIPLPTRESFDSDQMRQRWDRASEPGPLLNIMRLLMVNPGIRLDARGLWAATGLSDRARELVILRAAFVRHSTYEWHQHVRIARSVGLTDREIDGVRDWRASQLFSEDERALLAYTDALNTAQRAPDAIFDAVRVGRSDAEVLGVTFLITTYFQLAQVMATFDLEPEVPFVGWALA